jgi:hypothetical protein
MTVALVLATATVCDGVAEPASSTGQGGQAVSRSAAHDDPRATNSATGSAPATSGRAAPRLAAGDPAQLAACLPLPSLVGGQVTTQPLLTRLCGQLRALGVRDVVLIAPLGRGDLLTSMALEGLCPPAAGFVAAGTIAVTECDSIGAELRVVAAITRRLAGSGDEVLICAGDLVAHTEALARLQRSAATAALTAASDSASVGTGSDLWPALRLSGGRADDQGRSKQRRSKQGGDIHDRDIQSRDIRGSGGQGNGRGAPGGAGGIPAGRAHTGYGDRRAIVAAGSAFHRVHAPNAVGCGAFLVSVADGDELAEAAEELAALAAGDLTDDLGAADLPRDLATGSSGNLAAGPAEHLAAGPTDQPTVGRAEHLIEGRGRDLAAGPEPVAGPGGDPVAGQQQSVLAGPATGLARPARSAMGPASAVVGPAKNFATSGADAGAINGGADAGSLNGGADAGAINGGADAGAINGGADAGPINGGADAGVTTARGLSDPWSARHRSGFTDSVALLLVGLVRSGVGVEAVDTSPLVCVRVQNAQQARSAAAELNAVQEDRIRLDAAVKRGDGLFATCFVSPYARYLARWAARRRLSPNAVTGMSIGLGSLAAVWFSAGTRAGMILGATFAFAALLLDCIDGQLARYVRGQTAFGSWLDAVGGRLTEFAVYAGLAAGAAVSPSPSVWDLAVAAMVLQSLRDMIRFCAQPVTPPIAGLAPPSWLPLDEPADYAVSATAGGGEGSDHDDADAGMRARARRPRAHLRTARRLAGGGLRWLGRITEFQPGERVAVIGITAIVAGPRTTLLLLLAWGLVSACLTIIGRMVRSFRPMTAPARSDRNLVTYRDDGIIAQSLGRFVDGQLPPLLPAVAGVTVTIVLSAAGVAHVPGLMVLAPVVAMALAGLGSGHPHDGCLDWLVPPLLQLGEYVFLTALALAGHVPIPLVFALIGAIALHHYDIAYRVTRGTAHGAARAAASPAASPAAPPRWIARAGLGWEGRMLAAALGAVLGIEVFAFAVLAVYLWVLFGLESLTAWIAATQHEHVDRPSGFPAVPRAAARPADVEDGGSR